MRAGGIRGRLTGKPLHGTDLSGIIPPGSFPFSHPGIHRCGEPIMKTDQKGRQVRNGAGTAREQNGDSIQKTRRAGRHIWRLKLKLYDWSDPKGIDIRKRKFYIFFILTNDF